MSNTNKKKIKRIIESVCKFFFVFGLSASIIYLIRMPESLLITSVTMVSFFLAIIATYISFNDRANERLVGMIWKIKYRNR
jgi:hypothetical protein